MVETRENSFFSSVPRRVSWEGCLALFWDGMNWFWIAFLILGLKILLSAILREGNAFDLASAIFKSFWIFVFVACCWLYCWYESFRKLRILRNGVVFHREESCPREEKIGKHETIYHVPFRNMTDGTTCEMTMKAEDFNRLIKNQVCDVLMDGTGNMFFVCDIQKYFRFDSDGNVRLSTWYHTLFIAEIMMILGILWLVVCVEVPF